MEALRRRIERDGSLRFDEYVELALYAPGEGFFARGGGAGRAGADFVTSPEVGPLFGRLVARYLDQRWQAMGRPDPYVVIEAAAGRGALAIAVLAAEPACAPALRYVLVERSEQLRERQHEHLALGHPFDVLGPEHDPEDTTATTLGTAQGPLVCSLADLPATAVTGVVIANELLDNVPFRLAQHTPGDGAAWSEVRVTIEGGRLVELLVPVAEDLERRLGQLAPMAPPGARVPVQDGARDWLARALHVLERGSALVIDYLSTTAELAQRPQDEWLRTYREHDHGLGPLVAPGDQDLTCEVAVDQLAGHRPPSRRSTQADWLRSLGIDDLVAEGRQRWLEAAAAPDLAAMRARSRITEAAALSDPAGLGAFGVLEWDVE
jgi:SAM-dependent MidA family methyltransferase